MPKFAANLSTLFTELSFLDRFAAAGENGFDAVEFLFPYACEPEWITGRLARYNLELVLHNLPPGDWAAGDRGMACDPRRIGEFQDSVELALDYAEELGVKQLHCMAGKLPPHVPRERAHATYVANLRFAAAALKEKGPRPADRADQRPRHARLFPHRLAPGGRRHRRMRRRQPVPAIRHLSHAAHGGRPRQQHRELLPLIRHIQLADVPGRHEPGTGEINYPYLFRLLDELGYDGWIGCEYNPRAGTLEGLGWREAANRG
jgi:hydroxypyruvate isomerase